MHLSRWGDGGGECAPATCTTGCFRRGRGLEEGERGEGEGAGGVSPFVIGGGLVDVGEEGVIQDTTDKSCGSADEGGGAAEALNVMPKRGRDERGRGSECVRAIC